MGDRMRRSVAKKLLQCVFSSETKAKGGVVLKYKNSGSSSLGQEKVER